MRIIISPAKKMNVDTDTFLPEGDPVFKEDTKKLMHWVQGLSYGEAKKLWNCNDKIAELNFARFREMDLEKNLTPALISYEGIQYQYMAPMVFTAVSYTHLDVYKRQGYYIL